MDVFSRIGSPVVNGPLSRENKECIGNESKGATMDIMARNVVGFDDFFSCNTECFESRNKITRRGAKNLLCKDDRL